LAKLLPGVFEVIKICGTLVFCIGFVSLVGYIAGLPRLYAWGTPPMALNSGLAFSIAGIGIFLSGLQLEKTYNGK